MEIFGKPKHSLLATCFFTGGEVWKQFGLEHLSLQILSTYLNFQLDY